jgi:type IV pilus assembly protein PilA
VTAIFKSEQAIRQSERNNGVYQALAIIPTGTPSSNKIDWTPGNRSAANAIDWMVEGSTYGNYKALPSATGVSLTVGAQSDIDGDGVMSCVALYQTTFLGSGDPVTEVPVNVACTAGGTFTEVKTGYGRPINWTENVF